MSSTFINLPIEEISGTIIAVIPGTVTVNQGTTPWTVAGDVTVDNGPGAAAVNIQDGGNSITVDGTVTTIPSGTQDVNVVSSITLAVTGPLTDAELRASPVDVDVTNFPATVEVTQGTTPWTVDGTVIVTPSGTQDVNIVSTITLPVSGPLTDTQLRATPVPVSGTVAVTQSTSPWIVDGSGSTQPVSGTVTAKIEDTAGNALTSTASALDVNIKSTGVTQPVSGTITANQGTSPWVTSGTSTVTGTVTANQGTSPWVENVSQFGGSNVVTGTGTSGAGIPRVTVSNDSNVLVSQATASSLNAQVVGNVAAAATDSGNPVKAGGKFNTTLAAVTNGQRGDLQLNQFSELAVITRNLYRNISGAATTTVKSGSGRLNAIVLNKGTSSTTITIYDNTAGSGTTIATISPANSGPFYLQYNAEFATGLTIVTTVSATDITVLYQ